MPDALDELLGDMTNSQPRVNEDIVDKLTSSPTPTTDTAPRIDTPIPRNVYIPPDPPRPTAPVAPIFDPTIHAGQDKRNADGSFTLKRGRKAKTVVAPPPPRTESDFRNLAVFITTMGFSTAEQAFGPVWKPQDKEREQMEDAVTAYARAKNMADFPPGIALLLVTTMYAIPRISHPETRASLRRHGETLGLVKRSPAPRVVAVDKPQNTVRVEIPVTNPNPTIRNENGVVLSSIPADGPRPGEVFLKNDIYGNPIYGPPGTRF